MGEQRINRIDDEDLPVPDREITPDEAKKITGGYLKTSEKNQKSILSFKEQEEKKAQEMNKK